MANDSDGFRAETSVNGKVRVRMEAGSYYAPKLVESLPLGQDAHFIDSGAQTFGVADGVSGCMSKGIDSGIYARLLMTNAVRWMRENGPPSHPIKVLKGAALKTDVKGSSTACIMTVRDNYLYAVNVGDSGFLHFRGGKLLYKSPIQQHKFNHPFQLSANTRTDLAAATKIKRALAPGDVIIAATDGLFDNLHSWEIRRLVNEGLEDSSFGMSQMARWIGFSALAKSRNPRAYTPFARELRKHGKDGATGGKNDDITVVVAYIVAADSEVSFRTEDICPLIITGVELAGSSSDHAKETQIAAP